MNSIDFYSLDPQEKRVFFNSLAEKTGMTPFAVEKDWWVSTTLNLVFRQPDASYMVFKGGTSLSKAWGLIQRFSEDLDFVLDGKRFGFHGELGKNQRDKLRKTAGDFIDQVFVEALKTAFQEVGYLQVRVEPDSKPASDRDRKINIFYPNVIPIQGYMEPRVQIEIGVRSLSEPNTRVRIISLLDQHYPEFFVSQLPELIPTVNPERTFLEKIFLLHEEFQRSPEKMRVERMSRHLYDIMKLATTPYADTALNTPGLYAKLVSHRHTYTRVSGVDYNAHQPQSINIIPPAPVIELWKADYLVMLDHMIYEAEPASFDELLTHISALNARINTLPWSLPFEFPRPEKA
ncbi:MAG: nucleotidyl transferase AbiEii/AbiGii toxin family protein [Bacteroidota bacterium]|jgi:hypothetical protein